MSYINKRNKLFMTAPKNVIVPVRSEARMKNYFSTTDTRAWSDITEERRQHILEYTAKNKEGFCLDKYIPLQTIFNAMMIGKNVEIQKQQEKSECLEKCLKIYSQLQLTQEQKRKLNKLRSEIKKVNGSLDCLQGCTGAMKAVGKHKRQDIGEHPDVNSEKKNQSCMTSSGKNLDMGKLNSKLNELEEMTRERDSLTNRVQKLENELLHYQDLAKDVEIYKNKSKMLDSALEERNKMSKKIEQVKDLEKELNELRKKAARVDKLEEELIRYTNSDRNANIEISKMRSKCSCLEKELHNVKMERDSMYNRIECMKKEENNLKSKCMEAEMLKLERDRLQIKLNELSPMQAEHDNLRLKCSCLENAAQERDIYKQKYDEVLSMECECEKLRSQVNAAKNITKERDALMKQVGDLESCICEQEGQIKTLVSQVDTFTRNKEEVQGRKRDAFSTMKAVEKKDCLTAISMEKFTAECCVQAECCGCMRDAFSTMKAVEKKDCLIATSMEKLTAARSVQAELKTCQQGLSCETIYLKMRLEELETENEQLHRQIKKNDVSLKEVKKHTKSERESVAAMKRELEAAKTENKKLQHIANKMVALTGHQHVQKILKQSQCAVKFVDDVLGKQCKEWDYLNCNKMKHLEIKDVSGSESYGDLTEELDGIQREKEKLEKLVEQIQNDLIVLWPSTRTDFSKHRLCKCTGRS